MIAGQPVVVEVFNDNTVTIFEPHVFGVEDVAAYLERFTAEKNRNFFVATLSLDPIA